MISKSRNPERLDQSSTECRIYASSGHLELGDIRNCQQTGVDPFQTVAILPQKRPSAGELHRRGDLFS